MYDKEHNRIMGEVVRNLEQVYDPEIPSVSVIHLGLIYDIEILEDNTVVKITHTLTSAFCPMADEINTNIKNAGLVEGIKESIANCTFSPPFNMDMVPEDTKLALGWF
tara:strand:+ start:1815 stop:2138 length:324 start_codon:yes stop_codon:yes gene_type:complete